jgi:hypothetical protein
VLSFLCTVGNDAAKKWVEADYRKDLKVLKQERVAIELELAEERGRSTYTTDDSEIIQRLLKKLEAVVVGSLGKGLVSLKRQGQWRTSLTRMKTTSELIDRRLWPLLLG